MLALLAPLRRIEDKLAQFQLELRPFHLAINLSNLHGNAEQPACYSSLLVVCDSTLTPSQRCDVPAPSKWPQQQHRFTSETSQE